LRSARTWAALAISAALPACGPIYLHDASTENQAEAAQSSFKAAATTAVFDNQKTQTAALFEDEKATVKAEIVALRDQQLILLLRNNPQARSSMTNRFSELTGESPAKNGQIDTSVLQKLGGLDERISHRRTDLDLNKLALQDARRLFNQSKFTGDVSDCSKLPAPDAAGPQRNLELEAIREACQAVDKANADIEKMFKEVKGGALALTLKDLSNDSDELKTQQNNARDLTATLKGLKDKIDAAHGSATIDLAKALKFCAADPSSTATSATAAQKPQGLPQDLQATVDKCLVAGTKEAGPLVNGVKHAFLADQIQSVISAVLATDASATAGVPAPPDATIAASTKAALGTLDLLTKAADDIAANARPSVNALLVALAYEQYKVALNDMDAQTLKERIALLEEKREAQVSEISHSPAHCSRLT
jgi:hypothetical protein